VEYKTDGTFFIINANNQYEATTEPFDFNKTYYQANTGDDNDTVPYV
jgi:hypothetical protein